MQPQGHFVLASVSCCFCLRNGIRDDGRHAGMDIVCHGHVRAGVQGLIRLLAHVHDVELVKIGTRRRHGEGEVLTFAYIGVGGVLAARGVRYAGK